MEYIQPVAQIIIERLWDPTARRVNYFARIEENMGNLRRKATELEDSAADFREKVRRAEFNGNVRTKKTETWLRKIDDDGIPENIKEIEDGFQQRNNQCFYGWCLDCRSRYELGKRIVKATQDVQDHLEELSKIDEFAVPPPPGSVQELPTTTIGEGTSTMETLDQVWNCLMNANIGIIGIWGKGGVGKTTVAKNINSKLLKTPLNFEVVIFVTVSRDWNINKLRNGIGKKLQLDLSKEEDETEASTSLFNKLKGKRFLLILDDMWKKVDLEKLGVPSPKENGGSKIIITTRYKGVCNDMLTDEEIPVEVLSDTEAWELFWKQAGGVIPSDVEPIARDVCNECHGLPLAIIVVGRALRKEADRSVWEHELRVLKASQFKLKGMEEVFSLLKFSYDRLETATLRNCFLYCSLFPEDSLIEIDTLIQYWMMEGFIERDKSLKDASAEGHCLLKELVDSCLLEKENEYSVKMHDVIRDVAIKITSKITDQKGRRFLVQAGIDLEECPKVEEWEGKDRISLMMNRIKSLPEEPKCTELSTLLLQQNVHVRVIPQSFFKQMENLRVLDLSSTDVESLPPSISQLRSLQALILKGCGSLFSVTHVGGLEQLQLLDLSYTDIVELPREIGQLTKLRRLDLSFTYKLADIPVDIIVSLSLLEDLKMLTRSDFSISDRGEALIENLRIGEALIENLRQLNHLSHFSVWIPNDLCSSSQWIFLLEDNLKTFHLQIGNVSLSVPKRRGRYLDITTNANVSQEAVGLLQYAEILRLAMHHGIRTISAMGACNLMQLKACKVVDCHKIENIIITEEAEERILPNLEILFLNELPNLRSIWEGNGTVLPAGSFGRIKNITIINCDKIMHLFSSNVLPLLNSLEELNIISCPEMVEIVTGEVGDETNAFPKMRSILLHKLPTLNIMWEGILSMRSLQEIEVTSCTSLTQLPIDIEKTPALQVIRGERKWWDGLKWQNDSSKSHFQNIFKLVTHGVQRPYPRTNVEKYFS